MVKNPKVGEGAKPSSFKAAREMSDERIFYAWNLGIILCARWRIVL